MSEDQTSPEYIEQGPKVDMTIRITGRLIGPTRVEITTLNPKTGEPVVDGEDWENFPDALVSVSAFAENSIGVLAGVLAVEGDDLVETNGATGE